MPARPVRSVRPRDQRGAALPSPLVALSVVAVAMAAIAIAFVATRGAEPTEREITPAAQAEPSEDPTASPREDRQDRGDRPAEKRTPKPEPEVERAQVYVEVYNNSSVTGLAGRVAAQVGDAGWQVVGADNWYGTIPTSTVYYPARLKDAAELLADDLGLERTVPAVDPMRRDRLTLILTGEI